MALQFRCQAVGGVMVLLLAAAGAPGADTTNMLTVRGETRTFIVHVPPSYTGNRAFPVLIMFHGLGSTAAAAASAYYDWVTFADTNQFIAVFPESLTPPGKNIEFPPGHVLITNYDLTGKRWDIAHVMTNAACRCDSPDIEFVALMVGWLASNYQIRASNIFTTGHSYGALFSYYAAVCLTGRVAAFAEHSGGIYEYDLVVKKFWWPIDVPTNGATLQGMLLHSPADDTVGFSNSVLLYTQMTNFGHPAQFVQLPDALGHGWDTNWNQAQWDFCLAHSPWIDADEDGMNDSWEYRLGLDPATNDAALDPDGDGAANAAEALADTHPGNANSVFRLAAPSIPESGRCELRWPGVASRRYSIYRATNWTSGYICLAAGLTGSPPVNVYTDAFDGTAARYRVMTGRP